MTNPSLPCNPNQTHQPKVKVKKLDPLAHLPLRAHAHDSGADLFALKSVTIAPRSTEKISTGIAVELPPFTSGLIWGKSSVESQGIKIMAGLIDANYRGELLICLYNLTDKPFEFKAGQKIAQLLIVPTLYPGFEETQTLTSTSRESGGFGSTGSFKNG